jgi:hypothetical protein
MTFGTFLISILITISILVFIRIFWKQLAVIAYSIYVIGHLSLWSLVSAILWAAFVTQSEEGWGWTWLYFFLTYGGLLLVYALIILDIFDMAVAWIKSLLK